MNLFSASRAIAPALLMMHQTNFFPIKKRRGIPLLHVDTASTYDVISQIVLYTRIIA